MKEIKDKIKKSTTDLRSRLYLEATERSRKTAADRKGASCLGSFWNVFEHIDFPSCWVELTSPCTRNIISHTVGRFLKWAYGGADTS